MDFQKYIFTKLRIYWIKNRGTFFKFVKMHFTNTVNKVDERRGDLFEFSWVRKGAVAF